MLCNEIGLNTGKYLNVHWSSGLPAFEDFPQGAFVVVYSLFFILVICVQKGITWESTDYTSKASKCSGYLW